VNYARTIVYAPEAARDLDALDASIRERVELALQRLAVEPMALRNQIKRLKGYPALRLRVADWRIIFEFSEGEIVVLAVAHRREVYGRD
jgi:mRNA interferase RelE/StbE